jgi:thiol-disulfide isomerase/thioredoxin
MSAPKISEFIEKVTDGKVEPLYRSEAVPTDDGSAVKVLVGSNMVQNLFQKERDVMLLVVAPWCGHCKKLFPEYEKVQQTINNEGCNDLVQLYKLDGVASDSPLDSVDWTQRIRMTPLIWS